MTETFSTFFDDPGGITQGNFQDEPTLRVVHDHSLRQRPCWRCPAAPRLVRHTLPTPSAKSSPTNNLGCQGQSCWELPVLHFVTGGLSSFQAYRARPVGSLAYGKGGRKIPPSWDPQAPDCQRGPFSSRWSLPFPAPSPEKLSRLLRIGPPLDRTNHCSFPVVQWGAPSLFISLFRESFPDCSGLDRYIDRTNHCSFPVVQWGAPSLFISLFRESFPDCSGLDRYIDRTNHCSFPVVQWGAPSLFISLFRESFPDCSGLDRYIDRTNHCSIPAVQRGPLLIPRAPFFSSPCLEGAFWTARCGLDWTARWKGPGSSVCTVTSSSPCIEVGVP